MLQLPGIESAMKSAGETILTPLVSLDTPGKATVQVVIVADPVSKILDCPVCRLFFRQEQFSLLQHENVQEGIQDTGKNYAGCPEWTYCWGVSKRRTLLLVLATA